MKSKKYDRDEFDFIHKASPGRRFILRGKPIDNTANRSAFVR